MKRLFLLSHLSLAILGLAFLHWSATEAHALQHEAGFMAMEPVPFYFHYGSLRSRLQLRSSEARIWYSFQAADLDPADKPLFVFFNGGPGSATSSGLMSMYTSRYSLDNRIDSGGGDHFNPNSTSWTRLGNLLYVDARQAGFSYNLMNGAADAGARFLEFNAQNFNPFFDGADFVRLLLRFLARHPEIQENPVVIVGESYGGVRATVMLHLLLNYPEYGNGIQMYQDPALVAEIQAHMESVFPEYRGRTVPPEVVSRQFGRQILVQPALSMGYQVEVAHELWSRPESVLYRIGEEVGIPYDPQSYPDPLEYVVEVAGRDAYTYTKPAGWLNGFFSNAGRLLRFSANLSLMTGTDVTRIQELRAANRSSAYRVFDPEHGNGSMPGEDFPRGGPRFPEPAPEERYPTELEPRPGRPESVGITRIRKALAADRWEGRWSFDSWAGDGSKSRLGLSVDKRLFLEPARLEWARTKVEPGDMERVFGELQPWDRYFLGSNMEANWAFHFFNVARVRGYEVYYAVPRIGRMFLQNVVHVRTFVTDAALDLVVFSEALPPALAQHTEVLAGVQHVWQLPANAPRPGQIVLEYRPDAFPHLAPVGTRTIRFPIYADSCHAVSLTQPEDLFHDVQQWLGVTRARPVPKLGGGVR